MELQLRTLGSVRCFRGEDEIPDLARQPLRCAVLVYLAVERAVTRESLTTLLWPEPEAGRARHALNQKLYELRQVLGDDWLESNTEPMRVTSAVGVDIREFEDAVERGAFEDALAIYAGPFLADFHVRGSAGFEHWADRHRFRLVRLHRKARRAFVDRCVTDGDLDRAIAAVRRWIELDPLEDEAHHRLIALLADSGARANAIRQYESYERLMEREELQPLEQTVDLIDRVRSGDAAAERAVEAREGTGETDAAVGADPAETAGARHGIADDATPSDVAAEPGAGPVAVGAAEKDAATGEGATQAGGETGIATPPSSFTSWWRIGATAALVLLLLAGAGWWASRNDAGATTPPRSIAVLPFVNMSADARADAYLSDGIAEELIHALT